MVAETTQLNDDSTLFIYATDALVAIKEEVSSIDNHLESLIAVNRKYICYGLKLGNIRILNINTALRSLLRGHTQRVTNMASFAEDVHLFVSASVDGRVFVWRINEGPDDEDKQQLFGKDVAIQIIRQEEIKKPRVCWHPHK